MVQHVNGRDAGKVMLYALSTCGWCRKTRQLLEDLQVAYDYEYVDLLQGKERDDAIDSVERLNPDRSFPTIVFNDSKIIIGFKENEIREALKK